MLKLTISLSLNCQLKSEDTEYWVGLPLVWVAMPLDRWRQWYRRTKTALTVAGIGLTAVRYGVSL